MANNDKYTDETKKAFENLNNEVKEKFNFSISSFVKEIVEVDTKAREVAKSFGQGSEFLQAIKVSLTDAVGDVTRLGGDWSKVVEIQTDYSSALGRNVILQKDLYKDLYATSEVLGKDVNTMVTSFKDIGTNTQGALQGMQKVVDVSRASGVNAKAVTDQVFTNMSKMNQFTFQGGVEGMAKMAAQAVSLRVNMSETLATAEKVFNPEGAIEMAGAMQRLGVTQSALLDPLKLMDMAQNDPAELQNQISKMSEQFVQLNKDGQFEIMPGAKRQLREIESALGFNAGQLSKMALSSAEIGKKIKEIDFGSIKATDEQKTMIANMAEMGKKGYQVTFAVKDEKTGSFKEQTKLVSELNDEDLKAIGEASRPKTMEELQKESLNVDKLAESHLAAIAEVVKKGAASAPIAGQLVGGARKVVQTLGDAAKTEGTSPKGIRDITDKTIGEFVNKLADLTTGKISLKTFIESMGEVEKNIKIFGDKLGTDILKNLDKASTEFMTDQNSIIRSLTGIIKQIGVKELGLKDSNPTGTQTPTVDQTNTQKIDTQKMLNQNTVNTNSQTSSSEIKVDFNLKIDSGNPNIDPNQIMIAMEKQDFKQKMIESVTSAIKGKTGQIGDAIAVG